MVSSEKRKYKRLPIKLDLSCRKGGLYFETTTDTFKPGSLLKVELSIPPTTGLLESGGRISGLGKVLRIHPITGSRTETNQLLARSGVAVEFCKALKLCM